MRILVFFDLPVDDKEKRKVYTRFRKFLIKDGYDMIQFSVYVRVCNGLDAVEKHTRRLENALPLEGSIRVLTVTEMQYEKMKILIGKPTIREKRIASHQLLLF
jgi:CRISPR-associated protein Cas2